MGKTGSRVSSYGAASETADSSGHCSGGIFIAPDVAPEYEYGACECVWAGIGCIHGIHAQHGLLPVVVVDAVEQMLLFSVGLWEI